MEPELTLDKVVVQIMQQSELIKTQNVSGGVAAEVIADCRLQHRKAQSTLWDHFKNVKELVVCDTETSGSFFLKSVMNEFVRW